MSTGSKAELLTDSNEKDPAKPEVDKWSFIDLAILNKEGLRHLKSVMKLSCCGLIEMDTAQKNLAGWVYFTIMKYVYVYHI